jgi:hypothetical protein
MDYYHGSREGLILAGLARPEWFSKLGERERTGRRLVRHWHFDDGKVRLRWSRPNWFGLAVHVDDDERTRRLALGISARGEFMRIRLKPIRAARADAVFQRFMERACRRLE